MARWWAKIALAVLGAGLATASGINAAANHWRITRPDITLAWRPDDAVALALREDQRLGDVDADPAAASAASIAATARRALRTDPLTPSALRQIAMAEAIEQNPHVTRALVLLAHRVSRRELGTLVWLIQDSLDGGATGSVLRYFDEALLTNPIAPDMLYPALSAGLSDPPIRAGLVPLLRENRPWMAGLLHYAARTGEGARHVAGIVVAAGGLPSVNGYIGLNTQILSSLASEGDFSLARAYLRRVNGTGRDISIDPSFTAATINDDLGPFAWSLIEQDDMRARWDGQGKLMITLASGRGGLVASRALMAPPGRYRLVQSMAMPIGSGAAHVRWELRCLPDRPDALIWARDMVVRTDRQAYVSRFAVPDKCAGQKLALIAGSEDDLGETEIMISALKMVRY